MGSEWCSHCGRQLVTRVVGAENVFTDAFWNTDKYDRATGKRRLAVEHRCPRAWFSTLGNHTIWWEKPYLEGGETQ